MSLVWRRVLAWVLSLPLAILLSGLVAMARMPDAPYQLILGIGVGLWPILAFAIDQTMVQQAAAFDTITRGDLALAHKLAIKRQTGLGGRFDPYGTAALQFFLGNIQAGRARLAREPTPPVGPLVRLRRTVEAHAKLVEGGGAVAPLVLGELLALKKLRAPPAERYRALLIAFVALTRNPYEATRDWQDLVLRAIDFLANHRDEEARSYAEWLRVAVEIEPPVATTVAALRRSAALAAGQRLPLIASRLESTATTRERALAGTGPYRG